MPEQTKMKTKKRRLWRWRTSSQGKKATKINSLLIAGFYFLMRIEAGATTNEHRLHLFLLPRFWGFVWPKVGAKCNTGNVQEDTEPHHDKCYSIYPHHHCHPQDWSAFWMGRWLDCGYGPSRQGCARLQIALPCLASTQLSPNCTKIWLKEKVFCFLRKNERNIILPWLAACFSFTIVFH